MHRLSVGAFTLSFETILKRQYPNHTIAKSLTGKPSALAFSLASNPYHLYILGHKLGAQSRLYMVGDSLQSDINGGHANGFRTLLVETGNYKSGSDHGPADFVVPSVYEAVDEIIRD